MQTPEPLTTARLYELCELAKTAPHGSMVEISREELWALVDMAKERNEIFRDAERYRYFKECFNTRFALITLARSLGCIDNEFLPSLDQAIDAAKMAHDNA